MTVRMTLRFVFYNAEITGQNGVESTDHIDSMFVGKDESSGGTSCIEIYDDHM